MPQPSIFLVRHGQTQLNLERRLQGSRGDSPLTELGVEQATRAAELIRTVWPAREAFKIVSSPLGRAKATASIIAEALGLADDDYAIDDRLREMDFGDWTGLNADELLASFAEDRQAWAADPWRRRVSNGESYSDVAQRALNWFGSIETDTIAVAHGALGRILRGAVQGLDGDAIRRLDEPHDAIFRIQGSSVTRFPAAPGP